jgi:ubiquinone/menaquinone biosynthesis C-methylase UbiE
MPHGSTRAGNVLHAARAYDALVWVLTLGREGRFRERLLDLARVAPGESVLDVGCGTGTLAVAARSRVGPVGEVCGIDPSPEMVARAQRKASRAGAAVPFRTASVDALPFPDATFDVVTGTLMLHHLDDGLRRRGIAEIARVLTPGGRFVAVDIGRGAGGRHRGLLHRIGSHGEFDLDDQTPLLEETGLSVVDRGEVGGPRVIGISDLRFVVAKAPAG